MSIIINNTNENDTLSSSNDSQDSPIHSQSFVIDMSNNDNIVIENIQVEDNLISYTDNHFMNKAQIDLQRIRNLDETLVSLDLTDNSENPDDFYNNCDSPITIHGSPPDSQYGSPIGSCENSDCEMTDQQIEPKQQTIRKRKLSTHYKKLEDSDIEQTMDKYYDIDIDNKLSGEIDILTTYMKGQKNIFIQSKKLSQWQLNCLTIPSLLITAYLSIGTSFIHSDINIMMISILNGIIALLISLTKLLKLESYTETYFQTATQYGKMESMLEMTTSKLVALDNDEDKRKLVLQNIKDIELRINEMKEGNSIIFIPAEITSLFPIICHINIFSFINKMEMHKKELIVKLKDVKNEIRYILHKWDKEDTQNEKYIYKKSDRIKETKRLKFLYDIKIKLKNELGDYRNVYGHMDNLFTREIKRAERKTNKWGMFYLCCWRITPTYTNYRGLNPILDKYFQYISTDDE
jgi:hypothetical protein